MVTTMLVWCKCKRHHGWLDIARTNKNFGPVHVYQTSTLVGASLTDGATVKDVANYRMQLVTDIAGGWVQT